jgi:DNA recombination protein RmuC
LAIVGFLIVDLRKKPAAGQTADQGQSLQLLMQRMDALSEVVDRKMSETTKNMSESMRTQFSESSRLIRDVTEGLTKLDQTKQKVMSFADKLKQLQDILKNPKQRGVLGEYYLETLLKNVLPPGSYEMQKGFADGTIVDAAVLFL